MAHKRFLDHIVEKANSGDIRAQQCMSEISKLSGPLGTRYWICDEYAVPTEAEVHERRSLQAERSRLRLALMQRLM
jgi:hypothetical protein